MAARAGLQARCRPGGTHRGEAAAWPRSDRERRLKRKAKPPASAGRPAPLRLLARAKINLYLHVVGRRSDGYHLVDSLVCFTELGDELRLAEAPALGLAIDGPFAPALGSTDNLTLKAARLIDRERGAAIHLVKNLPVAAGIGGGSADAAAAIVGLARLWGLPAPAPAATVTLGADLPVCLAGGPCFVGGIGEELAPAPALPKAHLLLVNPRRPLPTVEVFRRFGRPFSAPSRWSEAPADVPALAALLAERGNDLTEAALALLPEIGEILRALAGAPGCLLARMSGSGATCFGLFQDPQAAALAAARLQVSAPHWWVRATAIAAGGAVEIGDSSS